MKIIDDIAYATASCEMLQIVEVKVLEDYMLLLLFNNNEERLFDAQVLFDMPAFEVIKKKEIFKKCEIICGTITWLNGEIDIAPETVYVKSFKYDKIEVV